MTRSLQLVPSRNRADSPSNREEADRFCGKIETAKQFKLPHVPARSNVQPSWDQRCHSYESGQFFRGLSIDALANFDSFTTHFQCASDTILILEEQTPATILFLLGGQINISMNSSDGRRFLLGIASAGEVIGLASAVSGDPSGIKAEARYPCHIASMRRENFLDFLQHYPAASRNVALELSLQCTQASARLRILGLTSPVTGRLSSLLLDWCRSGRNTNFGTEVFCALTHGEIGECIGASRESVSRAFACLKNKKLVSQRGSILIIPSLNVLAAYARIDPMPDQTTPVA